MKEISDDVLEQLVEYSKEYFKNVDESFFSGLVKIFLSIGEKMKHLDVNTEKEREDFSDQPPNLDLKIFDIAEEFFKSLDPTLADMARNMLRSANIYMTVDSLSDEDTQFLEEQGSENGDLTDATFDSLPIEKSFGAVVAAVHEVTHRFTNNDDFAIFPTNDPENPFLEYEEESSLEAWNAHTISNFTRYILTETVSIYTEQLCADFIKDKYNVYSNVYLPERYKGTIDFAKNPELTEISYLEKLKEYVKMVKSEGLTEGNKSRYKEILNNLYDIHEDIASTLFEYHNTEEGPMTVGFGKNLMNFTFSYITDQSRMGFIFANYLYQSSLGDKQKQVEIIENLLSALSVVTEFGDVTEEDVIESNGENEIDSYLGEEEILHIQKTGLPIVNDGKLSINSEGIKSILDAFDTSLKRDISNGVLIESKENVEQRKTATMQELTDILLQDGIRKKEVDACSQPENNDKNNPIETKKDDIVQ